VSQSTNLVVVTILLNPSILSLSFCSRSSCRRRDNGTYGCSLAGRVLAAVLGVSDVADDDVLLRFELSSEE